MDPGIRTRWWIGVMPWSEEPYATGISSVRMTGSAPSNDYELEYMFEEISGVSDGVSSGWQDSLAFNATGLSSATTYTYRINVRKKSGSVGEPYSFFSSVLQVRTDSLAHTSIISTSPADDSSAVVLDANLIATFDEAIAFGSTGNIELWETGAPAPLEIFPVETPVRVSISDRTLSIDPTDLFESGKPYHVRIDTGAIVNLSEGNAYAGIEDEAVWNFTVDNSYDGWITAHGVSGALAEFTADADGDGISNGLENYFGTAPTQASGGMRMAGVDNLARTLRFTHPRNTNPAVDIFARYRWSSDLRNWKGHGESLGGSTVIFETRILENSDMEVTATASGEPLKKLFITLEVVNQ